jgi:hypothetical protein
MDYLMAPLDFTEVSSGLLLDKGFPMMEIAAFDGTANADTLSQLIRIPTILFHFQKKWTTFLVISILPMLLRIYFWIVPGHLRSPLLAMIGFPLRS